MKLKNPFIVCCVGLIITTPTLANDTVANLVHEYQTQASRAFTAEAGRQLWITAFPATNGKQRSCTTCHTDNPVQAGKHVRTGKRIEPLAPSINRERLTEENQIRKWLKRNCKWTLGRECTADEKGNLLTYLNSL